MGAEVLSYEAGQTPYPMEQLTDAGDAQTFESSIAPWSDERSVEPVVLPYGVLTGGAVSPESGVDDSVVVAPLTVSMAGSVAANAEGVVTPNVTSPLAVTRGTGSDTHRITSITVAAAGTLAAVAGAPGESFTEARGADGGPPWIPDGAVEIAQVRLSSIATGQVLASEIFQVPNVHRELADQPGFDIHFVTGSVKFQYPLPLIHTGGIPKQVHAKAAMPIFVPIPNARDWSPAETTYNVSSDDTYDGPVAPREPGRTLGAATFSAMLKDGLRDSIVRQKGKRIWMKFQPDRDRPYPYQLTLGVLGVERTWPAGGGNRVGSFTLAPSAESYDVVE